MERVISEREFHEKYSEYLLIKSKHRNYFIIKRIGDIILSLIILSTLLPILVIIAIIIKIDSRGPVLFIQYRIGQFGRIFKIYKLRTMARPCYNDNNQDNKKNELYITRIGNYLRKSAIDEIPQFMNILKSDMSYIGPRPLSLEEYRIITKTLKINGTILNQGLIPILKPGITNWAYQKSNMRITYEKRFKRNSEYENDFSFIMDLEIFLKTFIKNYLLHIFIISILIFELKLFLF